MEPFGKDHGTTGGSYDTGKELSAFFGYQAPEPLTYEWISLKGQGAMSSSVGNTIGPMEALRLVPPEILRLLVTKTKPNKAIEFDTGMGLVTIADEYERLASRDFEQELAQEDLSRRQKVQVEDAQAAVRYSVVTYGEEAVSESVSFRHLAMLAQIRIVDDDVFTSLRESGMIDEVTESLKERLHRMRYWISSQHFPEEMKIQLQSNLSDEFLASRTTEDQRIYSEMKILFESIPWKSDELQTIFGQVSQASGIAIRDVYRASYMLFLDSEKGPRLAPILEAWHREGVLDLLEQALR